MQRYDFRNLDTEPSERYLEAVVRPEARAEKFRFGPYEADTSTGELRKHGLRIQLRAKSFEVLVSLLEHPGELVTREELRHRLWSEGIFIVSVRPTHLFMRVIQC